MAYGELKVDSITFTNGGTDTTVSVSGLVQNPTFSGDITVTGTISGSVVQGGTTVSGATVTGTAGEFGTVTGNTAGFTTVTGTTVTGTTANFVSGVFTSLSGTTATVTSGVFASGTAAAPSVSVGTTDNGLYSPGTDEVAISTSGNGRLFVDSSGNVGLNESSPGQRLVVGGDLRVGFTTPTDAARSLEFDSNRSGAEQTLTNITFDWNSTAVSQIRAISGSDTTNKDDGHLAFFTSAANSLVERLRITSDGKVGLGTSSPAELLDVNGAAVFAGGNTKIFAGGHLDVETVATNQSTPIIKATSTNGEQFRVQVDGTSYFAGNVGIGTTSPGANLELGTVGGSDQTLRLNSNGNGYLELSAEGSLNKLISGNAASGSASLSFEVSSGGTESEAARIDSSGRLLVGTSSDITSNTNYVIQSVTTGGGSIALARNDGTVGVNESLGRITFYGNDGGSYEPVAQIECEADDPHALGDKPGRLVFSTTADGASSPTERMRISQDGRVSAVGIFSTTSANTNYVAVLSTGLLVRSSSSAKYKQNIETLEDSYADALLSIRPVWYRSTSEFDNPKHSFWGFIAEEVAEIDPRLVNWKTVEVTYNENGSPIETPCDPEPEGVAYDRFVPHLLNLIKRQKEQIEAQGKAIAALEARLSALEAS